MSSSAMPVMQSAVNKGILIFFKGIDRRDFLIFV